MASKPSGGLARSARSFADRTRSTLNVRISPERSSSAARYHFAAWNTNPYGATIRSASSRPGVEYRIRARRFRRIAAASVRTTSVTGGWPSLGLQVHPRLPSRAPTRSRSSVGSTRRIFPSASATAVALPLILTHGWPGSVAEFLDLIGPLTDPGSHGGDAAAAFELVIPSIPGYGFSGPTREAGWDSARMAKAWDTQMQRLGYERYGAHGGDAGALITRELGILGPEGLVGVHLLQIFAFPSGDPDEMARMDEFEKEGMQILANYDAVSGYVKIHQTPRQTLATLTDSPAGQLAWNSELFMGSAARTSRTWTATGS